MDDIIKKQKNNIPQELQEYLNTPDLAQKIEAILENQPLQQEQIDAFGVEVMLVLLQFQSIGSFSMNIKQGLQISGQRADEIARRTKQAIFLPIIDFLIADDSIDGDEEPPKVTNDIMKPGQITNQIHNEEVQAPVPTKPKRMENVEQQIKKEEAGVLDVFKKRLTSPVHTLAEKERISETSDNSDERKIENIDPSSKEQLESDPYKESIG